LLLLLLLLLLQQQKGLSFNAVATPTTDVFPHCLPFSLAAAELSSQLSAQLSSAPPYHQSLSIDSVLQNAINCSPAHS
jgi:hypothetical protein